MEKKNYLNNKELLKEIHKSKISFSWIKDQKYSMYDIIVRDLDEINEELLAQGKLNRAKRLSIDNYDKDHKIWEQSSNQKNTKPKLSDYAISPETIDISDLVIRLMTFDHIPKNTKKENPKTVADSHVKCNFPPFKHFVYIDNKLTEVVRSHWEGDLETGHFSLSKGKMTNRLGSMMIMLVNRYSMRGNWRGYSYVDEMRSAALVQLAQIGLYFDESKSQNPFAYYTTSLTNSFTGVLNSEKRTQNIRDDLLQDNGYLPSFTRQLNDEEAQQTARKNDYDAKIEQEQNEAGYNL